MTTQTFLVQTPAKSRPALKQVGAMAASLVLGLALLSAQPVQAASGGPGARHGGAGFEGEREGHGQAGRHLQRMLQTVNATPEQRSAVKQIVDAAKPELKTQREAMRSLHQQQQALFAQPNIDARAAETLRQQGVAQQDQISRRMLQLRLDIAAVLTPEQRASLAEKMAQRRAMHERHRSEREALSGQR